MTNDDKDTTAHASVVAYQVEARIAPALYIGPVDCGGLLLDTAWRHVPARRSPIGVPALRFSPELSDRYGLLSFESASALAWWFLASIESLAAECRLVAYIATVDIRIHRDGDGGDVLTPKWRRDQEAQRCRD